MVEGGLDGHQSVELQSRVCRGAGGDWGSISGREESRLYMG